MGKESTCFAGDAGGTGLTPGQEDPLEESMVIYSGILTWRIPGILQGAWWATVHWVAKELAMAEVTKHRERIYGLPSWC